MYKVQDIIDFGMMERELEYIYSFTLQCANTDREISFRPEEKVLAISHCNCPDRARRVKEMLLEKISPRDVIVLDTAGISSMYAADGGIIVVV